MSAILEYGNDNANNTISFNNNKNEINITASENNCTFDNLIPNIYKEKNSFEKLKELQLLFHKY